MTRLTKATIYLGVLGVVTLHLMHGKARRARTEALCNAALPTRNLKVFPTLTGVVESVAPGRYRLRDPRWVTGGKALAIEARVWGRGELSESGHWVRLTGPLHCRRERRNPGRMADGFSHFAPLTLFVGPKARSERIADDPISLAGGAVKTRAAFVGWLRRLFLGHPGLHGLELALWTGDTSGLPKTFRDFYRDGGMLHFLAVSGLRVLGLVLLGNFALEILLLASYWLRLRRARAATREARRLLPLAVCAWLAILSGGAVPVVRLLVVWAFWWLLQRRGLECSPSQRLFSSIALLLLWDPAFLASSGFFWSAVATAFLCQFSAEGRLDRVAEYVFAMGSLPVLVFPLGAFFSARVPWGSPVLSLVIGWIWELGIIPVGYGLPFVAAGLPGTFRQPLLRGLEWGWERLVAAHSMAHGWKIESAVIRPSWIELIAVETLLLVVVLAVRRAWLRHRAAISS